MLTGSEFLFSVRDCKGLKKNVEAKKAPNQKDLNQLL
jgi:hypothetical protein